jgi:protein TonB
MKLLFLLLFFFISAVCYSQAKDSLVIVSINSGTTKDTVGIFQKVEIEAFYPGGATGWRNYLVQNLNANAPLKDLPKKIKYFEQTAIVQFIVCTDGSVCDVKVINDVLPSIKKEAEKAIKKSGIWTPAQQDGRKVKAYRKQPITFVVTSD